MKHGLYTFSFFNYKERALFLNGAFWSRSSAGEHYLHTVGVRSSILRATKPKRSHKCLWRNELVSLRQLNKRGLDEHGLSMGLKLFHPPERRPTMNEAFTVFRRKERKSNSNSSTQKWYVYFRNPVTGERMGEKSLDSLNRKLFGASASDLDKGPGLQGCACRTRPWAHKRA